MLNIQTIGSGKPLVFFHGWGFDHLIWFKLAASLKDHYTIYLVDLPGFGHSSLMTWVQFKSALIEQLPAQFAVVGWSMGGLFATRLALEERRRVTHLMNVATSPRFLKETTWPGIEKKVLDNFFSQLVQNPEATVRQFLALQLQSKPLNLPMNTLPPLEGLQSGLHVLAEWDLRARLHQLTQPVCYVFGRLDTIIPIVTMKSMQLMYTDFNYVVINRAAHVPFMTHEQDFISVLKDFY